jgi:hypothetical protein
MKTQSTSTRKQVLRTLGFFTLCMILCLSANTLYAQDSDRTVTGVVTSLDGPVLGASIVLKGTAIGVESNDQGEFRFPEKLAANDVLVISYLGYKTNEVTINENTTFIKPFLEDISIVIVAALRTDDAVAADIDEQ